MSVTVDTNVLVYASNRSDAAHDKARALIERLSAGPTLVYLFWPTIVGYLRIVTHPGVLPRPLTLSESGANIAALLGRPHIRTPGEQDGFWDVYRATSGEHARGNDMTDAHIAALMRQHGVGTIYTRDRDFKRYDGIDSRDPFG